jgi:hypothetical protein
LSGPYTISPSALANPCTTYLAERAVMLNLQQRCSPDRVELFTAAPAGRE